MRYCLCGLLYMRSFKVLALRLLGVVVSCLRVVVDLLLLIGFPRGLICETLPNLTIL